MNDDKLDTSMCMATFEHVRRLNKFTITYYPAPHIPTLTGKIKLSGLAIASTSCEA